MTTRALLLSLLLFAPACARDLHFGDDSRWLVDASVEPDAIIVPPEDGAVLPEGGPQVVHAFAEVGYFTRVNAQSDTLWVYLDLDTGAQVFPETPATDTTWDIAFQRSNIAVNGGISGAGSVEVAATQTPFAELTTAPTEGYASDLADSDDEDTLPDYAFRFWYDYDVSTHILTPAPVTYVVRTTEGAFATLRIDAYYDAVGTSGSPSFHYRVLP